MIVTKERIGKYAWELAGPSQEAKLAFDEKVLAEFPTAAAFMLAGPAELMAVRRRNRVSAEAMDLARHVHDVLLREFEEYNPYYSRTDLAAIVRYMKLKRIPAADLRALHALLHCTSPEACR